MGDRDGLDLQGHRRHADGALVVAALFDNGVVSLQRLCRHCQRVKRVREHRRTRCDVQLDDDCTTSIRHQITASSPRSRHLRQRSDERDAVLKRTLRVVLQPHADASRPCRLDSK